MYTIIEQTQRFKLVADQLASSIRSGELALGQKMPPDKDLVESFQVSRATIREAMIALEVMGLVETKFGSGAYVSKSLPKFIEVRERHHGFFENVEARYWIEPEVAALAAMNATEKELSVMRRCVDNMMVPGISSKMISRNDCALHLAIAEASRNTMFISVVELLWEARKKLPEWTRHFNERSPDDKHQHLYTEHANIVDEIEKRDPKGAHEAMRIHCRSMASSLLKAWHGQETEVEGVEQAVVGRLEKWQL